MNNEIFVDAVKQYVRDAAIDDVLANLRTPPGRRIPQKEKMCSDWYNGLSEAEKDYVSGIVANAVNEALFGLFAVLDGVRAIEEGENKGRFELNYVSEKAHVLLNKQDDIGLHDLFNAAE